MQTEQVNSENDDSGDALSERYISFKTKICLTVQASLIQVLLEPSFSITLHVCIGTHVNYVKFERPAWPYPPYINCLLMYKISYPSYRFYDAKLSESENPVSYTDHTQLTMYTEPQK